MKTYNVVVIGCGSIGAMKSDNIDYPGSPNILTHANAVKRHPRTELLALIDTDKEKAKKAFIKWNPKTVAGSFNLLKQSGYEVPDIAIIAVPTETHYEILHQIYINNVNKMPKLIIAEKPFCSELNQARSIAESYSDLGIPIVIDYIRRYAQGYKDIKKQIDFGAFGKTLNCRVLYTRGMKHEGCHALDLMRYFFGECNRIATNEIYDCLFTGEGKNLFGKAIIDRDEKDPTEFECYGFEKCDHVVFMPCDGRKYGIFEVDICFEKCRLRFIDNGLYIEKYPINEENEWGHKSLDYRLTNVTRQETGLNIALYNLINNAVNFLDGKEGLICTNKDAIKVHEILNGEVK